METRANYVIIGLFTVLAILAGLGFFLWLAKVQIDKTYSQYDILFDTVAGLATASPVRFNGVDVGQVTAIELDRDDSSRVRVRIEVSATTPVRQGTEAVLESQGVTGVAFIALSGGEPSAARLDVSSPNFIAVIPSKTSAVQDLLSDAPDLLTEAIALLQDLKEFTGDENRAAVASILANVDSATARLDSAISDFSQVSDNVGRAVDQISAFTSRLDTVANNADSALATASRTLDNYDALATAVLPQITSVADQVGSVAGQLTSVVSQANGLIAALSDLTRRIESDPARFFLGNQTPEYTR
jgi:phospholipid/cholesterol/gamma-HCH transport system substrate-binding protein